MGIFQNFLDGDAGKKFVGEICAREELCDTIILDRLCQEVIGSESGEELRTFAERDTNVVPSIDPLVAQKGLSPEFPRPKRQIGRDEIQNGSISAAQSVAGCFDV